MPIDFIPLKLYSNKAVQAGRQRGELFMHAAIALTDAYFRFTKVRYAGRFERGKAGLSG